MDDGFWYSIPPSHHERIRVGTIVRVPLGGRRVRGYSVELGEKDSGRLKPLTGVSGELDAFGPRLRDALVWAAHHYVSPVSAMLERSAPPNLPSQVPPPSVPEMVTDAGQHPLDSLVEAVQRGRRRPTTALLSAWEDMSWLPALLPLTAAGRSVLVVVATAAEAAIVARNARRDLGERVLEASGDLDDAGLTSAWSRAASHSGQLVVGTPRVAAWPIAGLAVTVVVEEGRRAMKDRQTPTVSVSRLLMTRARLEGFTQVYVGPTPSLELLASGAEVIGTGSRAWPLVEVVDRTEEPPGGGLISSRARTAITATVEQGGTVLVFTHRRGYAPAYRCATCRELRRCPTCGSRPEPGEACARCGTASQPCTSCGGVTFEPLGAGAGRVLHELRGLLGERVAAAAEANAPVLVGTEADLAGLTGVDLAVAVDVDGLAFGSHFRAGEEALRILARVAGRVRRGRGHRLVLQTSMPDQPLILALRRGEPLEFLHHELAERERMGYPPVRDLMVIEAQGQGSEVDADLRGISGDAATVMGPADSQGRQRWLIQGEGLGGFKTALRPLVQRWRDSGVTVRIDVDPLDL